jgi:hypothetical protein
MPDLIQIIPKTRYEFDGRIGSSQSITLKERIPAVAFGSGVLVVRVHEIDGWATSASATVGVRAQSVAPEDPGLEFVDCYAPRRLTSSEPLSVRLRDGDGRIAAWVTIAS